MDGEASSDFDQEVWVAPGRKVRVGDITADLMVDLVGMQETEEQREALRTVAAGLLGHDNLEAQQRARTERENLEGDD